MDLSPVNKNNSTRSKLIAYIVAMIKGLFKAPKIVSTATTHETMGSSKPNCVWIKCGPSTQQMQVNASHKT